MVMCPRRRKFLRLFFIFSQFWALKCAPPARAPPPSQPNTGGVRPVGMEVTMDPLAPFPSSLTLHVSTHTMYQMMVHSAGPRGQEPVYGRNLGAQ